MDRRAMSINPLESFADDILAGLTLEDQLEAAITTSEKLNRMLSVGSAVSISSSQAAAHQNELFHHIGRGTCGTVFERPETTMALKKAKREPFELWNDYLTHVKILEKLELFKGLENSFRVPLCYYYINNQEDPNWWLANEWRFPAEHREPAHILCTERILPLPEATRKLLIEKYCPEKIKEEALASIANRDCLVRIYLGRTRRQYERPPRFFTLRNFILNLDQIQELELDAQDFARRMANALAFLHWTVHSDANDIEFVLGSFPAPSGLCRWIKWDDLVKLPACTSTRKYVEGFMTRVTEFWVLDFNLCNDISMDEKGVAAAVKAFLMNDPYFPRPFPERIEDGYLWETFEDQYLITSSELMDQDPSSTANMRSLPELFISGVIEKHGQMIKRKKRSAEIGAYVEKLEKERGYDT
ncbi:MAG: hypothetical protein M1834_003250 [Cirrosporium novae-zelandiae]|nr:MAG: hypothetical protein M1834_003250 [Cirrosporium novae-zelandiae]